LGLPVRSRVAALLRTVSQLLAAIHDGDYLIRAAGALGRDALAEVMRQVNAMSVTMHAQRLGRSRRPRCRGR
jgi:hypothetical protein